MEQSGKGGNRSLSGNRKPVGRPRKLLSQEKVKEPKEERAAAASQPNKDDKPGLSKALVGATVTDVSIANGSRSAKGSGRSAFQAAPREGQSSAGSESEGMSSSKIAASGTTGAASAPEVKRAWRYRKGRWMYVVLKEDPKKEPLRKEPLEVAQGRAASKAGVEDLSAEGAEAHEGESAGASQREHGEAHAREGKAEELSLEGGRSARAARADDGDDGVVKKKRARRRSKGRLTMPKKRAYLNSSTQQSRVNRTGRNVYGEDGVDGCGTAQVEEKNGCEVAEGVEGCETEAGCEKLGDTKGVGNKQGRPSKGVTGLASAGLKPLRKMLHRLVRRIHYSAFTCPYESCLCLSPAKSMSQSCFVLIFLSPTIPVYVLIPYDSCLCLSRAGVFLAPHPSLLAELCMLTFSLLMPAPQRRFDCISACVWVATVCTGPIIVYVKLCGSESWVLYSCMSARMQTCAGRCFTESARCGVISTRASTSARRSATCVRSLCGRLSIFYSA